MTLEHYNPNQHFKYNNNQDHYQNPHQDQNQDVVNENTYHDSQDLEYRDPEHYQNEYQDQNGQLSYDFNDNIANQATAYEFNEIK